MDPMRRMSDADRAGFVARSPEGHAARSMSIKGQEEVSFIFGFWSSNSEKNLRWKTVKKVMSHTFISVEIHRESKTSLAPVLHLE